MDHQALKERIERDGIKKTKLAERTGLTPQGFYNKLNGDSEFNRKELEALKDALHLSDKEFLSLFFSSNGF
jgi:transcriptional regulator with XRE-family HTH domain